MDVASMGSALALLQAGRALAAGYVLLMVFIVILAILLALIAVLLIILIVRMGRMGRIARGTPPAGATRAGLEPPRAAGEASPATAEAAEDTPTSRGMSTRVGECLQGRKGHHLGSHPQQGSYLVTGSGSLYRGLRPFCYSGAEGEGGLHVSMEPK
jgi:hypothetical protein